MPPEYKAIKSALMGIDGRTVTGVFAVHGNVDAGDGWTAVVPWGLALSAATVLLMCIIGWLGRRLVLRHRGVRIDG